MFLFAVWLEVVRYSVFVRCVVEAVRYGVFVRCVVEVVRYIVFVRCVVEVVRYVVFVRCVVRGGPIWCFCSLCGRGRSDMVFLFAVW